ncbi:MAG: hypothetical protein AB7H77_03890 [Bdellovibrionales bacterium]
MRSVKDTREARLPSDAGIAIGPILFIIAILGILAAAIAAGSGSFTAGTQNEGNSTKASALIQIGENLKVGMDRLMLGNSTDFNSVVIDVNNTSNSVDLFSPSGGGIAVPSTSLSADPVNDLWYYPTAIIPQMGTSGSERLAMLQVTQGICDQINSKANALDITVANYDSGAIGDPTANNDLGNLLANGDWPEALNGRMVGCVYDTGTSTYWFYQVLAIQ